MTVESLNLQPTLEGELVALRPVRPDDFDALLAVASDPLIWEQHPDHDRWQRPVFERFFADALASGGALVVTDRATGAVIGSSRYWAYDERERQVEIGWTFLARSHWGGRYNGDMKRLMLAHAFRCVERVHFAVGAGNIRSQRAVEHIGGVRVGTRQDPRGRESVVFAIDRPARSGAQLVVEVYVSDLGRSVGFYEQLGFVVERRSGGFASLRFEGQQLFLDEQPGLPMAPGPVRANVRVLVQDVDAMWRRAEALQLEVVTSIADRAYGLRDFIVRDPDGFGVRFASRLPQTADPV